MSPAAKVITTFSAKGSTLTLQDLRDWCAATAHLPADMPVTATAGDSQRDGRWWSLSTSFEATP